MILKKNIYIITCSYNMYGSLDGPCQTLWSLPTLNWPPFPPFLPLYIINRQKWHPETFNELINYVHDLEWMKILGKERKPTNKKTQSVKYQALVYYLYQTKYLNCSISFKKTGQRKHQISMYTHSNQFQNIMENLS